MAGAQFEYDEEGGTFYFFLVAFYLLIMLPITYYVWPRKKTKEDDKLICHCDACVYKKRLREVNKPAEKFVKILKMVIVIGGWIGFAMLVFKVAQIKSEHKEYDPFAILGIDAGAELPQIKAAYRKLSKIHHPDRGGLPKRFVEIAKAYEALTNEEVKENWVKYGNPDGPGAMKFGIALPAWIVEKENSLLVLGVYCLAFMVVLPVVVGTWWYRSIKYSADQVLLDTTQLYLYYFHKTPLMIVKRVIMILGASFEFEKDHSKEVAVRPSDAVEMPLLVKELPYLNESNKERPLCFPYSIKARALIQAHLHRIYLNENTLDLDRRFTIRKCPILIQEMVTVVAQLSALANAGRIQRAPALDTLENTMKVSPMVVQALWDNKNALMQLPHFQEDMIKHCVNKKRQIKSCADLAALEDGNRRSLLRTLHDHEYQDVLNVLCSMPSINLQAIVKVEDDDESHKITVGALCTVVVKLRRSSLFSMDKCSAILNGDTRHQDEDDSDVENVSENGALVDDEGKKSTQQPSKGWEKKKKKGANKNKKKPPLQKAARAVVTKVIQPIVPEKSTVNENNEEESKNNSDEDRSDDEKEVDEQPQHSESEQSNSDDLGDAPPSKKSGDESDDDFPVEDEMAKRERMLETKSKITHPVHCPHFPDEKYEWWWVYVCDRKQRRLITPPVQVTSLVSDEEIDLKFPAPEKLGSYTYQVCLRSDSYADCDQVKDIKFDVYEAPKLVPSKQWESIPDDDEGDNASGSGTEVSESDYEEDEDFDDDD